MFVNYYYYSQLLVYYENLAFYVKFIRKKWTLKVQKIKQNKNLASYAFSFYIKNLNNKLEDIKK